MVASKKIRRLGPRQEQCRHANLAVVNSTPDKIFGEKKMFFLDFIFYS